MSNFEVFQVTDIDYLYLIAPRPNHNILEHYGKPLVVGYMFSCPFGLSGDTGAYFFAPSIVKRATLAYFGYQHFPNTRRKSLAGLYDIQALWS